MSKVERLSHIALRVQDLDRSVRFYTEVVGLTVRSVGKLGDAPLVVLREGLGLTPAPPGAKGAPVLDHLAFKVEDLGRVLAALEAAGIEVADGPRPSPYGNSVYFYDPDGNKIECHDGERED